ncbi:MAG: hypothetical protein ACXQTL_07510, partial [Methanosarcinales archaeon]
VKIDDVLVDATDWLTQPAPAQAVGTDDWLTDTDLDKGQLGFTANGTEFVTMLASQAGFFLRDNDLFLNGNNLIYDDGRYDYERGNVDSARSAFINLDNPSGTYNEVMVVWLDDDFDESIDVPVNADCAQFLVESNIVIGPVGKLTAIGCYFRTADDATRFIIDTSAATLDPPFDIKGCRFPNLLTTIRPLLISEGMRYTLDPLIRKEFLVGSVEDTHDVETEEELPWGADFDFNSVRGHNSPTVTLRFRVEGDMCLYGTMQDWEDRELDLELFAPRVALWRVKIVRVSPLRFQDANMERVEFDVTFEKFAIPGL